MAESTDAAERHWLEVDTDEEPEYVGVCDEVTSNHCHEWESEGERCNSEATHTKVIWTGRRLAKVAVCDEHGRPERAGRSPFVKSSDVEGNGA